jgi:hypothetical protein
LGAELSGIAMMMPHENFTGKFRLVKAPALPAAAARKDHT